VCVCVVEYVYVCVCCEGFAPENGTRLHTHIHIPTYIYPHIHISIYTHSIYTYAYIHTQKTKVILIGTAEEDVIKAPEKTFLFSEDLTDEQKQLYSAVIYIHTYIHYILSEQARDLMLSKHIYIHIHKRTHIHNRPH